MLLSATLLSIMNRAKVCSDVWSNEQRYEEKFPHLSLLRFSDHGMQASQDFLMLKDLALLRLCKRLQLLHPCKLVLFCNLHAQRALCVRDSEPPA